jgi:hypothetical protein
VQLAGEALSLLEDGCLPRALVQPRVLDVT